MLRKASWIVLTLVGLLAVLGGVGSTGAAYFAAPQNDAYGTGGLTLADVQAWNPEMAQLLRGRRGTAAAYALAFATLFLFIVLGPYRRGERWAWWALFAGAAVLAAVYALRIPAIGSSVGAGVGVSFFVATLVGLLLDVGRLRDRPAV